MKSPHSTGEKGLREENLQRIKEACIKANPAGEWQTALSSPTLADILLTIPDNYIEIRLSKPFVLFINHQKKTDVYWNLKDSLHEQSDETLQFIADLLPPKSKE